MTVLTAYNEKVQEYNEAPNKAYKKERLASIIDAVKSAGHVFERMFTFAKKQVLDRIIYLLSGSGICKVAGDVLAQKCGVSIRTVRATVAAIKKTGQFEIGRLANERAGKYIFVDKAHPNYEWLMHDVFGVEVEQDAPLNARQSARLENPESLATVSADDENDALNGFNSFNLLKQANKNNNILDGAADSESGGKEEKSAEQERKSLQEFAEPAQIEFYDAIKNDPEIKDEIKDEAYTMALALGEAERIDVDLALEKVQHINADTDTHLRIDTTIRAVFAESYRRALSYKPVKEAYQAPDFLKFDWLSKKPSVAPTALAQYNWL